MNIEKSREEFETWVKSKWPDTYLERIPEPDHLSGNYWEVHAQMTWEAWQASRESLVIELHKEFKDDTGKPFGELLTLIANAILEDCRKDIHAAGVKTK